MAGASVGICRSEAVFDSPYLLIDDFLQRHPDQRELMISFAQQVRKAAQTYESEKLAPVTVAIIYPSQQVSDYWRRSLTSFKARMDEMHIRYRLDEYYSTPGKKGELEQHLQEALSKDPDYLVFTLDIYDHKELIEPLLKLERPKIILQNITTPLKEWEENQPFLYVGFDHSLGAQLLADYYIKATHGRGSYGVLYFTLGYVSSMRGDTFIHHMEKNSDLHLTRSAYTNGRAENAATEALSMLADPKLSFIYACSTDVALGAVLALKQSHRDDVLINGWGGGSAELDALMKGDLDVTIMRMNDDNGVAMAEAILMDQQGRSDLVPTIYYGDMVLVDSKTSAEKLDELKQRAFRYSGQ